MATSLTGLKHATLYGAGPTKIDGPKWDAEHSVDDLQALRAVLAGPMFRANKTSALQNAAAGAATRIDFNNEDADSDGAYNPTTNRFTPQVPGWYMVSLRKYLNNGTTAQILSLDLYKNGSRSMRMWYGLAAVSASFLAAGHASIFFNGTTDYVEPFLNTSSGTVMLDADNTLDEFSAFYMRP